MNILIRISLLTIGFLVGWQANHWFNANKHKSPPPLQTTAKQATHHPAANTQLHTAQNKANSYSVVNRLLQIEDYQSAAYQLRVHHTAINEQQRLALGQQLSSTLFKYGINSYFARPPLQQVLLTFAELYPPEPLSQLVRIVNTSQTDATTALKQLDELLSYYQEQITEPDLKTTEQWLIDTHYAALSQEGDMAKIQAWLQTLINRANDPSPYYIKLAELYYSTQQYEQSLATLESYGLSQNNTQTQELYQANINAIKQQAQQQLTLTKINGQFLVKVVLNNTINAYFLIDTGASISSIAKHFINKQPLAYSNKTIRLSTAGGVVTANTVAVNSLSVGTGDLKHIHLPIIDISTHYDGLLGMDFLGQYAFYIDQNKGLLYLRSR